jgi:hypothetical protein
VQAVFQNHKKQRGDIPEELFRDLFSLPGFSVERSWLNWPTPGALGDRVEQARQETEYYVRFFGQPGAAS